MKRLKLKLGLKIFLLLTVVYLSIWLAGELLLYLVLPAKYFHQYISVAIFFWVLGIYLNFKMILVANTTHTDILNAYMTGKMIKIGLSIAFLLAYLMIFQPDKYPFVISFMCNYVLYSALELYIYSLYTKRLSKHEHKHKNKHLR